MPLLKPTFSISMGALSTSSSNPAGGPTSILVERDMDVSADSMQLRIMDRSGIALGDAVTVDLGHDGSEERVFTGAVVALRPALAGVEIKALGTMNDLLNLRTASVYEQQTIGSIVSDLIGQAGLSGGTVDDGPTLPRFAIDRRLSAFAHAKDLADRLGYEFYADREGNIMFHALGPAAGLDSLAGGLAGAGISVPAVPGASGGGEGYAFGQHLIKAASLQQDAAWGTITVGGESPMSGQGETTAHWLTPDDASYQGSAGSGGSTLLILDPAARTKDLADRFAAGRLAVAARTAHEITIRVLGRPQVDLGDTVASSDCPDGLINGSGYVRAIRHVFGEGAGYITEFRISIGA